MLYVKIKLILYNLIDFDVKNVGLLYYSLFFKFKGNVKSWIRYKFRGEECRDMVFWVVDVVYEVSFCVEIDLRVVFGLIKYVENGLFVFYGFIVSLFRLLFICFL